MSIGPGEFVAVVGKSGSGKSTLLNLVAGLDRPTSGTVAVAGSLLAGPGEDALARWRGRNVGVVFQSHQLILVVLLCLLGAAVSSVAVGGLGLATSMGLKVLERAREIGVMRAIGATRPTIFRLLFLEGLTIAALSAAAALVLSLPLSAGICWVIGETAFHARLPLVVSSGGMYCWVLLSVVLTIAACTLAALRALRPTVRDVLVHE